MNKIAAIMMIAAFAAVSFTSCQKENANNSSDNTVRMRIHAPSSIIDTKTVVSENQQGFYDINWSEGDQIKVLEFADDKMTQAVSSDALSLDSSEATFDVSLEVEEGDSFLYETVYPAVAYSYSSFYRLNIPDNQKYSSSSYDGDADVLISRPFHENTQPEELALEYKRIGSAARMVLKGITSGETITKVTFSTEEGYIAGYSKFNPMKAEFLGTYSASKKMISLTPSSATIATGEDVVWFRLYAITLKDNFQVVVYTDAATYTKEIDLASADRKLAFNDGGLTKFNVAFSAENRKANSTAQYVHVTDASSLSAGDIIRLGCVAKDAAAGVMGGQNYLASVGAKFSNGVMTSNDAVDISLGGSEGAWTLITSEGQITTSAAKALKLNTGTEKTWAISISESGTASITAGSFGDIQFNSSNPRFVNYSTTQTSIEIYKLNDGKQGQALSFGDKTEFTATVGDEFVAPTLSGNKTAVTYTSSNTAVAEVNETTGAISIVRTGTAVITAFAQEDDTYRYAYAIYFLNVQDPKYTITISEDISNGKVKADKTEAPEGAKVTLTATPDTGYQFDSWSVKDASGEDVEVLNNSFTMPASNVTVSASFIQSEGGQIGDSYVLTSADIKAAHTASWTYASGIKSITAADGSQWIANNTYANKDQVTIQMNKGKESYILTPVAPSGKAISHLVVTCATSSTGETTSGVTRTFDIIDASTGLAVATNIEGDNLTAGIDVSGSYTQLKIAPNEKNGGACYIVNITVKLN